MHRIEDQPAHDQVQHRDTDDVALLELIQESKLKRRVVHVDGGVRWALIRPTGRGLNSRRAARCLPLSRLGRFSRHFHTYPRLSAGGCAEGIWRANCCASPAFCDLTLFGQAAYPAWPLSATHFSKPYLRFGRLQKVANWCFRPLSSLLVKLVVPIADDAAVKSGHPTPQSCPRRGPPGMLT